MDRKCETCRWWDTKLHWKSEGTKGYRCRRRAPVTSYVPRWANWPITSSEAWCGEWEAKDEPEKGP